jgi:putative transposase
VRRADFFTIKNSFSPDHFRPSITPGVSTYRIVQICGATSFFERAIDLHGVPEKITIDKSGANTAAITSIQADSGLPIEMRQSRYLNNIVEQDHRAVKRITRQMLGFKTFRCASILIAGVETMHMIRKGQLGNIKDRATSAANRFYSLAF